MIKFCLVLAGILGSMAVTAEKRIYTACVSFYLYTFCVFIPHTREFLTFDILLNK